MGTIELGEPVGNALLAFMLLAFLRVATIPSVPEPLGDLAPWPVPEDLEAAIMSCLEKDRADRPSSASALLEVLDSVEVVRAPLRVTIPHHPRAFRVTNPSSPSWAPAMDPLAQTLDSGPSYRAEGAPLQLIRRERAESAAQPQTQKPSS